MEPDCTYLSYQQTNSFSALVNDYIEGADQLKDFYQFTPNIEGIKEAIDKRKNYPVNREILVTVLQNQYKNLPENEQVNNNIVALRKENNFTVCTAHQPNLLTGYLYFFYKILHAIKMSESLNEMFPQQHFVPVYYMGSEDNDLNELGQFRFGNKKYVWDAEGQTGAVGKMKTKSLKPLLNELFQRFGPPGKHLKELKELISESYLKHENIAEATQYLVHQLFGKYGLVVINSDEAELKKMFASITEDDLFNHTALPIVTQQSDKLSNKYKAQAFPRPINLFYLKDGVRERIEKEGNYWKVLNTNLQFTEAELKMERSEYPERFSPNVILRGLFQETILPNICFIGGGSELAYWLQLKPLFDHYKVFYPVVYLRQSVQIMNKEAQRLMSLLQIKEQDVFLSEENLMKQLIIKKAGKSWSVTAENQQLENLLQALSVKAKNIDPTLEKAAFSVLEKMKKQINSLELKMYRAEKKKEETTVLRVKKLHNEIFPHNGLQERIENFMPYYLQHGFELFDTIKNEIKPFENQFLIVRSNHIS